MPKSPYLSKLLIKYLNVRKSYFAYRNIPKNIILNKNGKPLTAEMINRIVKQAGAFANVNEDIRISPHTYRNTYAQYQLKNGMDIYTLDC